jgi:CheY-specific phosphatase CheX
VEIPDELVAAIAEAVPFALREMAGVEAYVRHTHPTSAADHFGDMSAIVRLTAACGVTRLVMTYPEKTAAALTRSILTDTTSDVSPDMVRDCIGEVANVIAGQAKALLVGSPAHFTLSTPAVRSGELGLQLPHGRAIAFDSTVGRFTVMLCSEDNR